VSGLPALYVRMLRYRVAAMVWMFMLLGAAHPDGMPAFSPALGWATLALASSYVAATSVNDIADVDVDRVNHPGDAGRPLVSGAARERDLWRLHAAAAATALLAAVPLGPAALGVVACSLAIGIAYSLPPARLSYRTDLAPLVVAVAYVLVPFALGAIAAGRTLEPADATLAAALLALFLARITLKDFRDREGDARYGKPTLLLRRGKDAVCAVSLAALLAGNALLLAALRPEPAFALVLQLFVGGAGWMLLRLRRTSDPRLEQVAIGSGARMGNGLLVCVLAWLVLAGEGADDLVRLGFAAALALLYAGSLAALASRPDEVVIGYKG